MSGHPTLLGRGAVVVGATSGIGHAVATALARHGAGVVVNGRAEDTVDILTRNGHRAVGTAGNAADETVAAARVDTCVTTFGALDILVRRIRHEQGAATRGSAERPSTRGARTGIGPGAGRTRRAAEALSAG